MVKIKNKADEDPMIEFRKECLNLYAGLIFFTLWIIFFKAKWYYLFGLAVVYISCILWFVKIIRERDKMYHNQRFSPLEIFMNMLLLNIGYLTLITWATQILCPCSFKGLNSLISSLYFTVITFLTVGYGDITPKNDLAKVICMVDAVSNFLILVVVFNFFVLGKLRKKNYISDFMRKIYDFFFQVSSTVTIVNKELEGKKFTWYEWMNYLAEEIEKEHAEHKDEEKVLKEKIKDCKKKDNDDFLDIYNLNNFKGGIYNIYLNNREEYLLGTLYKELILTVLPSINDIEINQSFLIENGNLIEEDLNTIEEIEQGILSVLIRTFNSENRNLEYMKDAIKDARRSFNDLGYGLVNEAKFNRKEFHELYFAIYESERYIPPWEDARRKFNDFITVFKLMFKL